MKHELKDLLLPLIYLFIFSLWIVPYFILKKKGRNTQVYFVNLILGLVFLAGTVFIASTDNSFLGGLEMVAYAAGIWTGWGALLLLYSLAAKKMESEKS